MRGGGCIFNSECASEIDKVTPAEIAFAIFIAKHNLPMAVGDEFGLLAKKIPNCAPWWWIKILTTAFSRFFIRSVPLFRSLMLTPMLLAHPCYMSSVLLDLQIRTPNSPFDDTGMVYFRVVLWNVESTTGYTFTPCARYFASHGIDTR